MNILTNRLLLLMSGLSAGACPQDGAEYKVQTRSMPTQIRFSGSSENVKTKKPWNIWSHNWQCFKNSNLHSHSILFLFFYCLSGAWEEKTTICINPILSKERKNIKEKNTTSFLYTPRLGHACRNSFRNLLWVSSTI